MMFRSLTLSAIVGLASVSPAAMADPFNIDQSSDGAKSDVSRERVESMEAQIRQLQSIIQRREQGRGRSPAEKDQDRRESDREAELALERAEPFGKINGEYFVSPGGGYRLVEVPKSVYEKAVQNARKPEGLSPAGERAGPKGGDE